MIVYMTIPPINQLLRSSVLHYAHIEGDRAQAKTIAPRPSATLVINIKGSFRIDGMNVPAVSVSGIREHPVRLDPNQGPIDRIHVKFSPCGLNRFALVPQQVLKNRTALADEVFPAPALREMISELSECESFAKRARVLDRFFLDLYSPPDPVEEAIEVLANRICYDTACSLGRLLGEVPMSLRQTERNFARIMGLSPRAFRRIARFERAKDGVLELGGRTLGDVGLEAGYYDQSHFVREFKSLSSMAPGSYSFCAPPIRSDS